MIDHSDKRALIKEREEERQRSIKAHKESLAPVLAELREAGIRLSLSMPCADRVKDTSRQFPYFCNGYHAFPDLMQRKASFERFSVPWAKPTAGPVLLGEFDNVPKEAQSLRWALGNALEVVAVPSLLDKPIEIVMNKSNGKAREMFVLALAKIRQPRSVKALIKLLEDEQVSGHAVMALRKSKAPEALDYLEPFTRHPQTWVRNEAKKAIATIMKLQPPKL